VGKRGPKPGYKHSPETKKKISKARQGHGAYALIAGLKRGKKVIDRRTKLGRAILDTIDTLKKELGGNITQSQQILLDRITERLAILHLISSYAFQHNQKIINGRGELMPCLGRSYLSWAAELRRDLEALERLGVKKSTALDYEKYINELERVGGQSEKKK